jgi:hypothetical protein
MPSHDERVHMAHWRPWTLTPRLITARCFACDSFFAARTAEAAQSLLEAHKAREHARPDDHLGGVDA